MGGSGRLLQGLNSATESVNASSVATQYTGNLTDSGISPSSALHATQFSRAQNTSTLGAYSYHSMFENGSSDSYWNSTIALRAGFSTTLNLPPHSDYSLIVWTSIAVVLLAAVSVAGVIFLRKRRKTEK